MKLPGYSDKIGLYIHVPFCRSKCIYCGFYSEVSSDLQERYISSLIREMELYSGRFRDRAFTTIYIGGGTPSILNGEQVRKIFEALKKYFHFETEIEVTIEANPESISSDTVRVWKEVGINRVSIGVQSAHDAELRFLGRAHNILMAEKSIKIVHKEGFPNINIDLIFGIPGQTIKSFMQSIEWAVNQGVTHISTYSLTVEPGTLLHRLVQTGKIRMPDEDKFREMYRARDEMLSSLGFRRYEISNFAIPGFESMHNRIYWYHGEYLGLGPSSASFVYKPEPLRWQNNPDLSGYIRALSMGNFPPLKKDYLNVKALLLERIFLYIRTTKGIPRELAEFIFSKNERISHFFVCGERFCALNFEGLMVADSLSVELFRTLEPYIDMIEL